MRLLLDTNVLLRHANRADALQPRVTAYLDSLLVQGAELCACAQNITELWAVSTRPVAANGLGMEPLQCRAELDRLLPAFTFLDDPPDLFPRWLDLCTRFEVRGRQVYDTRLVALMLGCGISRLVTLNPADFARFPMIEPVHPTSPMR